MRTVSENFNAGRIVPASVLALVGVLAGACDEPNGPVGTGEFQDSAAPQFTHASDASLPHIFNPSIALPASLAGSVSLSECSNSPGPFITFDGAIDLGGLQVNLVFQNNLSGTHTHEESVETEVVVLPSGESIVVPKQPVQGGAGGNPFIWVQLVNAAGEPVTEEIFLGRCVQGPFNVAQSFATGSSALADFAITSCQNSPGPFITVGGELAMGEGAAVRFILRNNDNPVGGPHEATVTRDIEVIPAGFTITFPKQPVQGGVGGNPWIFASFEGDDGSQIGEEELLGRCVQLSQELS